MALPPKLNGQLVRRSLLPAAALGLSFWPACHFYLFLVWKLALWAIRPAICLLDMRVRRHELIETRNRQPSYLISSIRKFMPIVWPH